MNKRGLITFIKVIMEEFQMVNFRRAPQGMYRYRFVKLDEFIDD